MFLEILQNSQENNYARVSFFDKVADLRLWHRFFPVNFAKNTPFTEHLWTTAFERCWHGSNSLVLISLGQSNMKPIRFIYECITLEPFSSRNVCLEVLCKKTLPENFKKRTGKYLCRSVLFYNSAGYRPVKDCAKSVFL